MSHTLLGDVRFPKKHFSKAEAAFKQFKTASPHLQAEAVNRALLHLIQEEPEPCFLLPAVLDFVDRVGREKILEEYTFKDFEFWLNQRSNLSFEENYRVRAKIAGQLVDRSDYQLLFPIGGGKIFEGTHFVTAHRSPDLDTTVASFWGWFDAFAARVSHGLHIWNVPGGPPQQIEIEWLFNELLGPSIFSRLAKTHSALHVTGNDLMTQKGMLCKDLSESIIGIDHDKDQCAVVIVDEKGLYLGEWHSADVERVRDVILLLSSCLRWFENTLQLQWMQFFGQADVRAEQALRFLTELFDRKLSDSEPALEFTKKQALHVSKFLAGVLGIQHGLEATFAQVGKALAKIAGCAFEEADSLVQQMKEAGLFNAKGAFVENRSLVFGFLESTLQSLHAAILQIRKRLERLDIALKTKTEVFGSSSSFVQAHADLEEVRTKMGDHSFLTVVALDDTSAYPIGVVHAASVHKPILGTVSLRDFCNREEMGIPMYLDVISVIDHHRTTLLTSAPPFAMISDAQSSNTLVAQQAFLLNDRYSLLGQTEPSLEAQLEEHRTHSTPHSTRLTQSLLQKRMIAHKKSKYFIHPEREFVEYLHLIYAIIDDTDLLAKVTAADVECVAELLNRMKSIAEKRLCEIVSLDDLPRNRGFSKKAAARILQQEDMYSLYRKVFDLRTVEIERHMELAASGAPSNLFADTKEQNGCCRIGQTKLFASNMSSFVKHCDAIRAVWQKSAEKIAKDKPDIALHLQMLSTIVSAQEVYSGIEPKYTHKDELWIWIPKSSTAEDLLHRFLSLFLGSPGLKSHSLEIEIVGERAKEFARIFSEAGVPKIGSTKGPTMAIFRFAPGLLNSRKAMVTPFLPKN